MAIPTQIILKPLKNTYRDGLFTPEDKNLVTLIPVDSDSQVTIGAIHKEDVKKLLTEIINSGGNPLDIFFYGTSVDDDSHGTNKPFSPPPDENSVVWFPLPNGTFTINVGLNDSRIVTDNWTWILVRVARTNAGQDTVVTLQIRGE